MRWLSFAILAYFILAMHLALTGYINWGKASPNLVLPIVVFICVNAPRQHALAGVFSLGLLQDLLSQGPLGMHAFAYGLAGLFVLGTQPVVYRDHWLTHMFVTFAAGMIVLAVAGFNDWAYPRLHHLESTGPSVIEAFFGVLYTALLAPLVLWPLVRLKRIFGFRPLRTARA
ncbi:MAG: rod shape-determining protein MreD [Tepidisphaerales bacterium]